MPSCSIYSSCFLVFIRVLSTPHPLLFWCLPLQLVDLKKRTSGSKCQQLFWLWVRSAHGHAAGCNGWAPSWFGWHMLYEAFTLVIHVSCTVHHVLNGLIHDSFWVKSLRSKLQSLCASLHVHCLARLSIYCWSHVSASCLTAFRFVLFHWRAWCTPFLLWGVVRRMITWRLVLQSTLQQVLLCDSFSYQFSGTNT